MTRDRLEIIHCLSRKVEKAYRRRERVQLRRMAKAEAKGE